MPALVVRCAQHLLEWGLEEEGLFRYVHFLSPSLYHLLSFPVPSSLTCPYMRDTLVRHIVWGIFD